MVPSIRFLFAALLAGGLALPGSRAYAIHYGVELTPEQFNTVGLVKCLQPDGKTGLGTGTLIAPRLVLTAAHVIENAPAPAGVSFVLETPAGPVQSRVLAYRANPGYFDWSSGLPDGVSQESVIANDIAILLLEGAFPRTLDYYPLAELDPAPGSTLTAIGYGQSESKKSGEATRRSGTLRFKMKHGNFLLHTSGEETFQRTDHGDSGGPQLLKTDGKYILASITQGYSKFDRVGSLAPDEYGFFVSIRHHRDWIDSAIEELSAVQVEPVRFYFKRSDPNQAHLAMTKQQVRALSGVGTPPARLKHRLLTRGSADPLTAEQMKGILEFFDTSVPPSALIVVDTREKPKP